MALPFQPDLLLKNARVVTMDPSRPEGGWIAAMDGRIMAVGAVGELAPKPPDCCLVVDCKGRGVLPGFRDAHLHLLSFAENLASLDLRPTAGIRSIADIQALIAERSDCLPPGAWIRAGGYHEFDLSERRHPNRRDLDLAAPLHPVKLTHRTGHAHVLNSPGLKSVGITTTSEDPENGLIDRDLHTGSPTGLLYEMGAYLSGRVPPVDAKEIENGIREAGELLLSYGITSIHDASVNNDMRRLNLLRLMKKKGLFGPRIFMMMGMRGFQRTGPWDLQTDSREESIQLSGVKIVLDETTGRLHPSREQLDEWVSAVHESGMQVAIHAVESNAIGVACTAIERALQQIPRLDHRHRIEHCSVCPPPLADRISKIGIRVVSQPGFIDANGDRYIATVPVDKICFLYPLGSLLNRGVRVAGSSDCPTAPVDPWRGICAAVTRKTAAGRYVGEGEAVDLMSALRMYTIHGAETTFSEKTLGSITPGKSADIILLNSDPFELPPANLKDIKVDMTIMDGKVVWKR